MTDTVELSEERIGEMFRKQVELVGGEFNKSMPEGIDKDKLDHWKILKKATIDSVIVEDRSDDIRCHFKPIRTTFSGRRVGGGWHNPPEYEELTAEVEMEIVWNMDQEEPATVWFHCHVTNVAP